MQCDLWRDNGNCFTEFVYARTLDERIVQLAREALDVGAVECPLQKNDGRRVNRFPVRELFPKAVLYRFLDRSPEVVGDSRQISNFEGVRPLLGRKYRTRRISFGDRIFGAFFRTPSFFFPPPPAGRLRRREG